MSSMYSMAALPSLGSQTLKGVRSPVLKARSSSNFNPRRGSVLQICCVTAQPGTLATVQKVIATQLSIEESTVIPEAKFVDLGADSLDTVEIVMNLEETFKVVLGEEGAESIVTVQDAADTIQGVLDK